LLLCGCPAIRWELLLSIVCTGLVRVLRSPIMGQLLELLVRLQDTRSSSAFVTMLLQVRKTRCGYTCGEEFGNKSSTQHVLTYGT
jgi:hypothetical protein